VNYYEHHLGDWAAATGHLTWDEDMAYTRLLRAYYHAERPISEGQQYRLAKASTPTQRKAVDQVLAEFFELRDGCYHQKRADEEIARYLAGEPEREVKKANESLRLKRHRDERSTLFKVITDAGQHAPWNAPMNELRELAKRCESPLPATAPATPATATQTPYPDTRHQITEIPSEAKASAPAPPPPGPDPSPKDVVYALGLPMLLAAAVPEERGRSFLGLLLRCNAAEAVAEAVQRCAREGAIQPIAYLQGCLKTSKAKASAHSGFASKDYRDGVTEDGTIAI
jgi:uncharacterized protein YdaU (DUF1376 family)